MSTSQSSQVTQYLIIGNGVAGISAAQEIRHADQNGHIVLIGDEGEPYYYRASLSEWISGKTTDAMLLGRTSAFYQQMRIHQVTGHIARIDPTAKRVHLDDGRSIGYDKLLIATGGRADVYPIQGLDQIMVFRTLADARTIKERLGCCGQALIVGGGILGLELAGALHNMGIASVAVLQRSAPLGKPLLDAPAAAWLQQRMKADGVEVFIGDTIDHVEGQTAYLQSGLARGFDAIIQAVGISPTFPKLPELEVGKGIRIDAYCRTNVPDVYAAGDCTEKRIPDSERWQTTRIWLDSAQQGKTAGRNMAGQEASLSALPLFNASLIYTLHYAYIGEPHGEAGQTYVWQTKAGYRKLRVVDGRLAGALLLGERRGSMALYKAIGLSVDGMGDDIAHPDLDWNDLTGRDWDYMFY